MQHAGTSSAKFGRVIIDLVPGGEAGVQVTVTRTCDKPEIVRYADRVLEALSQVSPGFTIKRETNAPGPTISSTTRRRGGPAGTPEDKKIAIIKGWLKVRGGMNQETYAQSRGVAPSTLRRWMRQLREQGKL